MKHSSNEATLSKYGFKAKADVFIENNGSLEEFKAAAKKVLKL